MKLLPEEVVKKIESINTGRAYLDSILTVYYPG